VTKLEAKELSLRKWGILKDHILGGNLLLTVIHKYDPELAKILFAMKGRCPLCDIHGDVNCLGCPVVDCNDEYSDFQICQNPSNSTNERREAAQHIYDKIAAWEVKSDET
jgi:hypothetical protein